MQCGVGLLIGIKQDNGRAIRGNILVAGTAQTAINYYQQNSSLFYANTGYRSYVEILCRENALKTLALLLEALLILCNQLANNGAVISHRVFQEMVASISTADGPQTKLNGGRFLPSAAFSWIICCTGGACQAFR